MKTVLAAGVLSLFIQLASGPAQAEDPLDKKVANVSFDSFPEPG